MSALTHHIFLYQSIPRDFRFQWHCLYNLCCMFVLNSFVLKMHVYPIYFSADFLIFAFEYFCFLLKNLEGLFVIVSGRER